MSRSLRIRRQFLKLERLEDRCLPSSSTTTAQALGQLPLSFVTNQGQTDPRVNFLARGSGYSLFLTPGQAVLSLQHSAKVVLPTPTAEAVTRSSNPPTVLAMQLVGANLNAPANGLDPLPGKVNYFLGNDPNQWHTDVSTFGQVEYANVYPGIDLVYYGNQQQLEYDFRVAPGANPNTVRLNFQGAQSLELDSQGNLVVHTAGGDVVEQTPILYQEIDGVRQVVTGHYVLLGNNQAGFQVGPFDRSRELVIDPVLVYSTYLGGSGEDDLNDMALDPGGNVYVAGFTGSTDFPLQNPFQNSNAPQSDAFVSKLNPTGTALLYSTYLGGSTGQVAFALAVNAAGEAVVTGNTLSNDWPLKNPFQGTPKDSDNGFLTKLSAAGDTLVFSTYLGGNNFDAGDGLQYDASGNIYVTGVTGSTDFPTRSPVQSSNKGSTNFFASEFTPNGSSLVFSTYLGGSGSDSPNSITVDTDGAVYVAGQANDTNFPTTPGAFQSNNKNNVNNKTSAVVAKLAPGGTSLVYSTYLGGSDDGGAQRVAADAQGNAYVTGFTSAKDFPAVNAFQSRNNAASSGSTNAFVTKLNPSGTGLAYSTLLGGSKGAVGSGIAVDALGDAFVTGNTQDPDFPTKNAIQGSYGGPSSGGQFGDAFITELAPSGSSLVYSTYLGGSGDDLGKSVAVDSAGNVYVGGVTLSGDFPTTTGAFQRSGGGPPHGFIAHIVSNTTLLSLALPAAAAAGTPVAITVTVRDPFGAVKAGYTGTIHFTGTDTQARLPSDFTFTAADQGTHTFSVTFKTAGSQSIGIADTAGGAAPSTGHIQVAAGVVQTLGLSGLPAALTAGNSYTVTVAGQDAFGNPGTGYRGTITFHSSDATASLPAPYTFSAADAGSKTLTTGVTFTKAGSPTLTLTDDSSPPLTLILPLTVAPAAPDHFQVTAPLAAVAEAPFAVAVAVLDRFGNLESGYNGTVTLSSSATGAGVVLPGPYVFTSGSLPADNGQHTFSDVALTAGTPTLTVTDSLFGITSNSSVTVTNPVPMLIDVSPPTGQVQGPAIPLTVTGSNFVHASVIQVNGKGLPTTFVSSTQLTATLPASSLAKLANLPVIVATPGPGGGMTAPVLFSVADAVLTVTADPIPQLLPDNPVNLAATFTYGRPGEPVSSFAATIDWGDGSTSAGTIGLSGSGYILTGSHSYSIPGIYAIGVEVADKFGGSAATTAQAVIGDANQRVLAGVYQDLLHRPIDGNGLPFWSFRLQRGESLAQVAAEIVHSDEHFASVIQTDYQTLLGREVDAAGLQYWTGRMRGGLTDEQLLANLLASSEFYARSGGMNDPWLKAVYPNVVARPANLEGESYWLMQLDHGANRTDVAFGMATAPEARGIEAQIDYTRMLGRTARPDELTYWVHALTNGASDEDVAAALAGSAEYFQVHT